MDLCSGHSGAADTPRGDLPPGIGISGQGSQVPFPEFAQVAKDVFSSHSEQIVLYFHLQVL